MAQKLSEGFYMDTALVPQSLNNTNATGKYYSTQGVRRMIFVGLGGAAAISKTFKVEALEATDIAGTSAQSIDSATGTANTKVAKATVALASAANTDTVTITTYLGSTVADTAVFTKAASTDTAAGEFADAAGLDACIDANITGATASNASTTTTVIALEGYTITVVGGDVAGTVTVATTEWTVVQELIDNAGDFDADYPFVAPKVTVTGNGIYGVAVIIEKDNLPITQAVAAS